MPDLSRLLDLLRAAFPYIIAIALPLAGLVLALVKLAAGDRDEAIRIVAAAVFGASLYALALS